MAVRIQMRRGTTSEWNSADPVLNEGEIGYNTTLGAFKVGDGSTIWSELDYYQTTANITPSEVGAIALTEKNAANGVATLDASKNLIVPGTSIIIEGTTNDSYETTLIVTDPTADRTITFPNIDGTVVTTGDTGSVTNTMLAGSIANNKLTNSSITINGNSVALGGSITLAGDIEGVTAGTGLSGGGTSGTVTLSIDSTVATTSGVQTLTNKTLTSPSVGTSLTTASTSFDLLNTTATTVNFAGAATTLSVGSTSGTTTVNNNLTVTGDLTVNGTTTTIDTQTLQVEDKNIVLGYGSTSDAAADGGGITLLGTTSKTFNWVDATDAWTSSEHINLASGKSYYANGTLLKDISETLTNKTINGANNTLTVRLANDVTGTLPIANGGTGATSASLAAANLLPTQTGNSGKYLTTDGAGTLSWGTVSGYSAPTLGSTTIASASTVTNINDLTINSTTIPTSSTLLVSGGALGTPSSATLTNATGLPISGLTSSTTTALGVGSIELGHATDTTIARSSAGVISVEGVVVPTISSTNTLTNKTLSSAILTGSLTAGGGTGTSGQVLSSTGSGVQWSAAPTGAAFSEMLLIGA